MNMSTEPSWIQLGHPSYVWRFGQDRRLGLIRQYAPVEGKSILDVGCGIGAYVREFRQFSDDVHGVDVDAERVEKASATLPNILVAPSECLPYPDGRFDVVLLHEVIEHVQDDRRTIAEAARVLRPGGRVVIFAPNRHYFFETHGVYVGRKFVFGNIPGVGYLPDALRDRLAPHVRAYTHDGIERLCAGLPLSIVAHRCIYPGFDNFAARNRLVGRVLRTVFYAAEATPLAQLGLSHLLVAERVRSKEQ